MTWAKLTIFLSLFALLALGQLAQAAEKPKLAFVRVGNIWIADSDGTNARQLTYSLRDEGPTVSPDGKWVAFYSWLVEGSDLPQIFMIPAAGGMVQQFRHPEVQGAAQPVFSPDGKQLLFVEFSDFQVKRSRDSENKVATISLSLADLASGTVRRIISHPNTNWDMGYIDNPAFSSDGRMIAYREVVGHSIGFAVVDLQGKRLYRFPKKTQKVASWWEATSYLRPQFSPDGQEILCFIPSVARNQDVIYLVNLASGKETPVALGRNPTFVEHGKAIVYQRWPEPPRENSGPDLWRLDLQPGASPKLIVSNAEQPAGQMP